MRNLLIIFFFCLTTTCFGKSIYDDYEHGGKFAELDKVMNVARFPQDDPAKVKQLIDELDKLCEKFPDYPDLAIAQYFLGMYQFQLEQHQEALPNLERALAKEPTLKDKTPVLEYIAQSRQIVAKAGSIFLAVISGVSWLLILLGLLIWALIKKRVKLRHFKPFFIGVIVGILFLVALFSIDTGSMADAMDEFYAPPTLVKSTIWCPKAAPLRGLLMYGMGTVALTGLSIFSSTAIKKGRIVLIVSSAIIFGTCSSVIFYNSLPLVRHTGKDKPKRLSFEEQALEWPHEIPNEMEHLYDEEMQIRIREAKEKRAAEL